MVFFFRKTRNTVYFSRENVNIFIITHRSKKRKLLDLTIFLGREDAEQDENADVFSVKEIYI